MKVRIIFSDNKNETYLVCTLGKKDKINYTQIDMFRNETYKEYFIIPDCTKNGSTTRISFNISGLTSLSEYIKTRLEQQQYFDIISGIQKIASFCKAASLPLENLICDPKYVYYNHVTKKVLMAFVPMQSPKKISMDIPACLLKIHKDSKDVIIKDGSYMEKYTEYLSRFKGKKSDAQSFSPDTLQHFFNENENRHHAQEYRPIQDNQNNRMCINNNRLSIYEQMQGNNNVSQNSMLNNPQNAGMNNIQNTGMNNIQNTGMNNIQHSSQFEPVEKPENISNKVSVPPEVPPKRNEGGTFIPSAEDNLRPEEEKRNQIQKDEYEAYLIAPDGKKIHINETPFTIGRVAPLSLVINEQTVSGKHAKIKKERDIYYLENWLDSNGTFLNETFSNRIQSPVKLNDGDRIYFYRTRYTFHMEKKPAPVPVPPPAPASQHTVIISQTPEARALAYIRKVSDGSTLRVMKYPFKDDSIYGVVFSMGAINNRTAPFVENTGCYSLKLENFDIVMGVKKEIFSGCSLFINGEKYMFIIEN